MRGWMRWLFALQLAVAGALLASQAAAESLPGEGKPGVVVTAAGADVARHGLVEALRIQLAEQAYISEAPALEGTTLADRTDRAAALLDANAAKLVVWVEREPDSTPPAYLLHIVGGRDGRVLVLVTRVDASDDLALDRALSLKVAEVFDAVMLDRPAVATARQLVAPPEPPKKPEPSTGVGFVGDISGWAATGSGTAPPQAGIAFSAGARLRTGAFVGELAALGRIVSELDAEDENGSVEATEGGFGAALRLGGTASIVTLGGEIDVGGRVIDATGHTPGGRIGSDFTVVPFVAALPQATFAITSFLGIRVGVGVEVALRRHRFAVNEIPVLDLGTVRGAASAGFVFSAP
jgi:hypothetical protein